MSDEDRISFIFEGVNALCELGAWSAIDALLQSCDPMTASLTESLAHLTISKCVKDKLREYGPLYARVRARIQSVPSDAIREDALLGGLQP